MRDDIEAIATRLIEAYDRREMLTPITQEHPDFDIDAAYDVLAVIEQRRRANGWRPVGRKIGFTNRTLWPRYDIWQPMWASMWEHGVQHAAGGRADFSLAPLVQPRIEPEVVFCLREPLSATDDATEILSRTEWIAAGFEIVHAHFPDWKFAAPDCTAAFGLHGGLVIGAPLMVTDEEPCLARRGAPPHGGDAVAGRARSSTEESAPDVLDSPALALAHLTRVLHDQGAAPVQAGDIVTTGTITDAWPVEPGRDLVLGLRRARHRGPRSDVHRRRSRQTSDRHDLRGGGNFAARPFAPSW